MLLYRGNPFLRHAKSLILMMVLTAVSCGSEGSDDVYNLTYPESDINIGDTVINTDVVWRDVTVNLNGSITIQPGASLTMINVCMNVNPEIEDSNVFLVNDGVISASESLIKSTSGKQWNMEAYGSSTLNFQNTDATSHTGIRAFGNTVMNVSGCQLEEIQCHDNSVLNVSNGSGVYIVLFFVDAGSVALTGGELNSGDDITRDFEFSSGSGTKGKINIESSDVWGFQLDLEGNSDLEIKDGTDIVLAVHLADAGVKTISDNITSEIKQTGLMDFGSDNPSLKYNSSQIRYINVYLSGITSNVTFSGNVKVVEANVFDGAVLTFESGTTLLADLAQAYDTAVLNLNGVKLSADGSRPSFTAEGDSVININAVSALSGTSVYSVENGKVIITGGSGWDDVLVESENPGNIIIK